MNTKILKLFIISMSLSLVFVSSIVSGTIVRKTMKTYDERITIEPAEPNGNFEWYITSVNVTFHAEDDLQLAYIYYKVTTTGQEDPAWMPVDIRTKHTAKYNLTITINKDGVHTASFYAVDHEGNIGPVHSSNWIQIDMTAPEVSLRKEKISFYEMKFTADVIDATSGIHTVKFYTDTNIEPAYEDTTVPYEFSWSGIGNHTITAKAYDFAGNEAITVKGTSKSTDFILSSVASFMERLDDEFILGVINNPPFFGKQPTPVNGSVNNSLSLLWSIQIVDHEGDAFSWAIQCSNGQNISKTNASGGIKSLSLSGLANSTTYKVWVNATDPTGSGLWTRRWYTFSTKQTINHPPQIPSNPSPPYGADSVDIGTSLTWMGGDPDIGDNVTYDVYFGSMLPLQKVASNISTTSYNPGILAYSLTYFWNVVAWDNHNLSTDGPAWHFTTIDAANNPPNKPSQPFGPTNGKVGTPYSYESSTTDIDGDQIYYLFDWGDGNNSGWMGPYNSGDICTEIHQWSTKGNYAVKVKAKDIYGHESGWSDPLPITMPYSYNLIQQFFECLFERFLNASSVLRHLLEY